MNNLRLIFLTSLAMVAFAANSILCRLALLGHGNNPMSFSIIRLGSGALVLLSFFVSLRKSEPLQLKSKTFFGPILLFSYAIFFSLAYVQMSAGVGALILFASVQITMILASILKKQYLSLQQKIGFGLALSGLIYLLFPGLNAPPIESAILMAIAGVSWGLYSLNGQGIKNSTLATSRNFVLLIPVLLILALALPFELTLRGWILALVSGAVTSGLGYILWYYVLKYLVTSTAAIVQLSVPLVAAIGGILFLGESITMRLMFSSVLIIGGIVTKISYRS